MVLDLLINPKKITGNPWEMLFIGAIYSFVAAFLALWIFKNYVSLVMITLTVVASVPFVRSIIEQEEEKRVSSKDDQGIFKLLKQHNSAIKALMYLFLGFTVTFTLLYVFMPSEVTERMFSVQLETIITVQSPDPTGNFISATGNYHEVAGKYTDVTGNYISPFEIFKRIFMNNTKILLFCAAFSFFFGAGAIFILTWNASVMATAIGSFIRNNLFYAESMFDYFQVIVVGLLQYTIHGIPEIMAYFIAALASGMVSFSLMTQEFMSPGFKKVAKDAGVLFTIAAAVIFLAALIEVYITPVIL
ncbi:hypothetical protein GF336_02520 [Candidatus Woesearchaeota archaeon]|nr:hypothetical protein [Candidatus Woesearchaeota archaeon]